MKALFQKSKESLNQKSKQKSMKNLFKNPKGMRNFILKNAMAIVAIAIAMGSYGLMSFDTSNMDVEWFPVETDGTIGSTPLSSPPSGNCQINLPTPTCAVELPSDHSYENIDEVPTNARKAGKRN